MKDGSKIPGTTTITGLLKDSGALCHWAWKCGMDGVDYRAVRDDAASAGTMAHAAIDARIHKQEFKWLGDAEIVRRAQLAYKAYVDWESTTRLEIVETEMPLVSEIHKFGGTPDAVGRIGDDYVLCDWKSGRLYPDHFCQLAAYRLLIHENRDYRVTRFLLGRFDKDTGDATIKLVSELPEYAERGFLLCRELYEVKKALTKRAA